MKYLRYKGEFLSVSNVVWRAELWQESDKAYESVGELEFDADEPLLIEWESKSKEEVICGSVATLKIISPTDRAYEDLYSIEVGRIRLDVYRNDALYWSGCIDTEFYEEPYERLSGYIVTVTFTDFGVLGRLKYDLSGMRTVSDVVSYCIGRCGINTHGIDESFISTQMTPQSAAMSLSDLKVRSDNFYDEDGEASTLAEVIKGMLQPLALRIVQRAGRIYVYDLNGLYTKAQTQRIEWDGSSQTMGVDVVYNNAKITWSTYAQSGNIAPSGAWGDIATPKSDTALNDLQGKFKDGARYFSFHYSTDMTDWPDATDCGFTIWLSNEGDNAKIINRYVQFFKIVPQYDGTESEGIAIYWTAVEGKKLTPSFPLVDFHSQPYGVGTLKGSLDSVGGSLFSSSEVTLPPISDANALVLRISIETLIDPRFNPFESAEDLAKGEEQKEWYDEFGRYGNFVYVPVRLKYQPEGTEQVYVWNNKAVVTRSLRSPVKTPEQTYGQWEPLADGSWGYLCYYDAKNHLDTSGVLGWKKNRSAINPHSKDTITALTMAEDGQFVPYPNMGGRGGRIWIEVCETGWLIVNEGKELSAADNGGTKNLWRKISWVLMKLPEIEIMKDGQFDKAISTDDVEYSAQLNEAAKDPIDIDTICGTAEGGVPTAKGAYFNSDTGLQVTRLTRAGRTSQAEDLLIGTLYSQFAQRHTTLSGEARLMPDALSTYSEDNQQGRLFMLAEESQDVRMDCSDATFIELSPDEYKRNDE